MAAAAVAVAASLERGSVRKFQRKKCVFSFEFLPFFFFFLASETHRPRFAVCVVFAKQTQKFRYMAVRMFICRFIESFNGADWFPKQALINNRAKIMNMLKC